MGAYLIPFIVCIILLIVAKRQVVWWEYIVIIIVSTLLTLGTRSCCIADQETDTEYLGGYVVKITHYDAWNEYVHRTCTREVPDGVDEKGNTKYRTETYDCSYVDEHSEQWTYTVFMGRDKDGKAKLREHYFWNSHHFYQTLKELGYPKYVFRDMHRDYYTKDGDAQDYYWDKKQEHIVPYVWTHSYKNKVNNSNSVFNFENISDKKAEKLGLFKYPEVIEKNEIEDQDVVLGFKPRKDIIKKFKYINSVYGYKKQFKLFVLVFPDKPSTIAEKQRSYWKGGNKNEFVVCIGYDTKTGNITWCRPFSWCDNPRLEVATKRYFIEHPRMCLNGFPDFLMRNMHLWERKQFADFEYIKVEPSKDQTTWIFISSIIVCIFLALFVVFNEINNNYREDHNSSYVCSTVAGFFVELFQIIADFFFEVRIKTVQGILNWWKYTLIPGLNRLEESYRNTFTWK